MAAKNLKAVLFNGIEGLPFREDHPALSKATEKMLRDSGALAAQGFVPVLKKLADGSEAAGALRGKLGRNRACYHCPCPCMTWAAPGKPGPEKEGILLMDHAGWAALSRKSEDALPLAQEVPGTRARSPCGRIRPSRGPSAPGGNECHRSARPGRGIHRRGGLPVGPRDRFPDLPAFRRGNHAACFRECLAGPGGCSHDPGHLPRSSCRSPGGWTAPTCCASCLPTRKRSRPSRVRLDGQIEMVLEGKIPEQEGSRGQGQGYRDQKQKIKKDRGATPRSFSLICSCSFPDTLYPRTLIPVSSPQKRRGRAPVSFPGASGASPRGSCTRCRAW